MNILIIHAKVKYSYAGHGRPSWHHFIECFTSKRAISKYLAKNPTIIVKETTQHKLNPK